MATQNDTPKSGSGTKGEAPPPQYSKVALIIGIAGQVGSYLEWRDYVVYDNEIPLRPAGVDQLRGDATKAKEVLGWKAKVGFEKLVEMMVDEDIELAKREKVLVDTGYIDVCNSRVLGPFRIRCQMKKTFEEARLTRSSSASSISATSAKLDDLWSRLLDIEIDDTTI